MYYEIKKVDVFSVNNEQLCTLSYSSAGCVDIVMDTTLGFEEVEEFTQTIKDIVKMFEKLEKQY